ncbi:MAG: SWIM zinc finger family protein [Nitrospira sp.]|nr:SWIM zinc finger family protein [Nitrospira sp.]
MANVLDSLLFNPQPDQSQQSYIVSQDEQGEWGCSCPVWKFSRKPCKHIQHIQDARAEGLHRDALAEPRIIYANVCEVTKQDALTIFAPLIPLNDVHFLATVCVDLYAHGVGWKTIQRTLLPHANLSRKDLLRYVLRHGRKIYQHPPGQQGLTIIPHLALPDIPKYQETPEAYATRTGWLLDLCLMMWEDEKGKRGNL